MRDQDNFVVIGFVCGPNFGIGEVKIVDFAVDISGDL